MEDNYLEIINAINANRKKYFSYFIISLIIGLIFLAIGIGFLIAASCGVIDVVYFVIAIVLLIVGLIVIFSFYALFKNSYKKSFYSNLKTDILKSLYGETYKYNETEGVSLSFLMGSGVIRAPDAFTSSQYFSYQESNIDIMSSNYTLIRVTQTTDSKGNVHETRTPYPGKIIAYKFPRNLKINFASLEKVFLDGVFVSPHGFGPKVEFESIEFNKKFDSFCASKEDAFYLMTPEIQMDLLDFDKTYTSNLAFVIKGNILYLILGFYDNHITFSLFKDFSSVDINKFIKDLSLPLTFLKDLHLDSNKFTNTELNKST